MPSNNGVLDATNLRLLEELQADARISQAELGRRVGLSAPAVAERLGRLERDGVIAGYRVEVDPARARLHARRGAAHAPGAAPDPRVADVARATPEVVECHRVTGEDCFYMKLHVRSVEHLEEVIDRFTPYGQTTTSIIQSSPVPRRAGARARGDLVDSGARAAPSASVRSAPPCPVAPEVVAVTSHVACRASAGA